MSDHEGFETQLAPLVEQMPELRLIATRAAGHVHQVDGHGTLVESAVVFVASVRVHALFVGSQKSSTLSAFRQFGLSLVASATRMLRAALISALLYSLLRHGRMLSIVSTPSITHRQSCSRII